jgi:small subunit ribosomal protein S9
MVYIDMQEKIGVGRRKTAVASVRLRKGTGSFDINGRKMEDYFSSDLQRDIIAAPFKVAGSAASQYDVIVRVRGGGIEGQAIAIRLGIARALVGEDEERKQDLRVAGYLTRDSRKKERKKYGLAGARKRFQFCKR